MPSLRARRPVHEGAGFQLAPMIDMTFLLLIFFMVTTRISRQQRLMDVQLPVARNAPIPDDVSDRDVLNVDATGSIFIGERPAQMPALKEHLRRRYVEFPPLRLYIRADRGTPAMRIKEIVSAAAEAGAIDIIFASSKQDGP